MQAVFCIFIVREVHKSVSFRSFFVFNSIAFHAIDIFQQDSQLLHHFFIRIYVIDSCYEKLLPFLNCRLTLDFLQNILYRLLRWSIIFFHLFAIFPYFLWFPLFLFFQKLLFLFYLLFKLYQFLQIFPAQCFFIELNRLLTFRITVRSTLCELIHAWVRFWVEFITKRWFLTSFLFPSVTHCFCNDVSINYTEK